MTTKFIFILLLSLINLPLSDSCNQILIKNVGPSDKYIACIELYTDTNNKKLNVNNDILSDFDMEFLIDYQISNNNLSNIMDYLNDLEKKGLLLNQEMNFRNYEILFLKNSKISKRYFLNSQNATLFFLYLIDLSEKSKDFNGLKSLWESR